MQMVSRGRQNASSGKYKRPGVKKSFRNKEFGGVASPEVLRRERAKGETCGQTAKDRRPIAMDIGTNCNYNITYEDRVGRTETPSQP
jgi:hypothetical protein